jgi:hypothetical protein
MPATDHFQGTSFYQKMADTTDANGIHSSPQTPVSSRPRTARHLVAVEYPAARQGQASSSLRAYMDLKPSNVVLSSESDAVLIDISGIGGVTRQWLCPEMLESKKDTLSWSIAAQQQNDIWALGQIMLAMADACCVDEQEQLLRSVALATTRPCPRIPLSEDLAALSERPFPAGWSRSWRRRPSRWPVPPPIMRLSCCMSTSRNGRRGTGFCIGYTVDSLSQGRQYVRTPAL